MLEAKCRDCECFEPCPECGTCGWCTADFEYTYRQNVVSEINCESFVPNPQFMKAVEEHRRDLMLQAAEDGYDDE